MGGLLSPGSGRVFWCYVCVCCEYGLFVEMADPVAPYQYLLPNNLSVADIENPDFLGCCCQT